MQGISVVTDDETVTMWTSMTAQNTTFAKTGERSITNVPKICIIIPGNKYVTGYRRCPVLICQDNNSPSHGVSTPAGFMTSLTVQ